VAFSISNILCESSYYVQFRKTGGAILNAIGRVRNFLSKYLPTSQKDRTDNRRSNFSPVSGKGLVCYKCISLIKSSHSLQTFITTLLQFSCAKRTIQRVSHISHFRRSGTQKRDEQEIKFLQTEKSDILNSVSDKVMGLNRAKTRAGQTKTQYLWVSISSVPLHAVRRERACVALAL
jgi:hypothetical protein